MAKAILLSAALLGGCRDTEPTGPIPPAVQVPTANVTIGKVLLPLKDTYVMRRMPDKNHGTEDSLRVQKADSNRTLIMFDQQALLDSIGGDSIISAKLEMTVMVNGGNWGTGGRYIWIYRMNQAWTEGGATWDCANDSIPSNSVPNCTGQSWSMIGPTFPFAATKTAQALITNTTTGVVWWNVTNDVRMYQAGTKTNYGWLLKLADETLPGKVSFYSRETALNPRLVLSIYRPIPAVPATITWPTGPQKLASYPADPSYVYYRDILAVQFNSSLTGSTYDAFVAQTGAVLIGGMGRGSSVEYYVFQFPDPGTNYSDLQSLSQSLITQSVVANVLELTQSGGLRLKGRFPNDAGYVASRADWLGSGTPRTWPWLAVRAPLAWGCETGMYGGAPPLVVVADAYFDALVTDVSVSAARIFKPQASQMQSDPGYANTHNLEHGAAIVGIFGATGDNSLGMAGMIWAPNVELYSFATGQQRVMADVVRLGEIVDSAIAHGAQVLSLSAGIGRVGNPRERATIKQIFVKYLASGPKRLLVLATGDTTTGMAGLTGSVTALSTSTAAGLFASDGVAGELLLDPQYQGKLLLVTGTVQGGASRFESHVWTGVSNGTIAAPAEDVYSLDPAGALRAFDGTSFAVPFVDGVATQLWTMDPTLSAQEVVDFIVRGAQQPRINPSTGAPVIPGNIGYPGVYQLDAYGSLSLLSKERAGTPICGISVSTSGGTSTNYIRMNRNPSAADSFPSPTGTALPQSISVAQGGRRMAIDGMWELDHHGSTIHVQSGVLERQYLERDTADIRGSGLNQQVTIKHKDGSPPSVFNPIAAVIASQPTWLPNLTGASTSRVMVSPAGDLVSVSALYSYCTGTCQQTLYLQATYLVSPTGSLFPIRADDPAVVVGGMTPAGLNWAPATWSHDGTRFITFVPFEDGVGGSRTEVVPVSISPGSGGSPTVTVGASPPAIQGRVALTVSPPQFTGDDAALLSFEFITPSGGYRAPTRVANGAYGVVAGSDTAASGVPIVRPNSRESSRD